MPDLGSRVRTRRLGSEKVLVDCGDDKLSFGEVVALIDGSLVPPLGADRIALAPANAAELVRMLLLFDGRATDVLLLPPSLADRDRAVMCEAVNVEGVLDRIPWQKLYPGERRGVPTRWHFVTSGTSGRPKTYTHSFASLSRRIRAANPEQGDGPVWGLLYDLCRFAGIQVILHALIGGGRLVAPPAGANLAHRIGTLVEGGCTHLSGTPSLWRNMLMSPELPNLALDQITLGGEPVDQPLLDHLARTFPGARVSHTYASTEAGFGFSVHDRKVGFPSEWLENGTQRAELEIRNGLLWIKPDNPEVLEGRAALHDSKGYICTQDRVHVTEGRVLFLGREGSVINVGGSKVHPEMVEAVLQCHPQVWACHVRARPSPILGNVLAVDVVARPEAGASSMLLAELKRWCRDNLPREARPATITLVNDIALTPAGKIARATNP